MFAGYVQNLIDRRQQRSIAFERKSFVSQIALLQRLLKQVSAREQIEGSLAIHWRGLGFDLFLNPSPPLGVGNVHEFDAHAAAINAPRFARKFVIDLKVGMGLRGQQA